MIPDLAVPAPPSIALIERDLIGGVLLRPEWWAEAARLRPDDFSTPAHRLIWAASLAVASSGGVPDVATVAAALGSELDAAGGWAYLASLADALPFSASVAGLVAVVREKSRDRSLHALAARLRATSPTAERIAEATAAIDEVRRETADAGPVSALDAAQAAYEALQMRMNAETDDVVPTGLPALDQLVQIRAPKMIFLAARPGVGKTALALQIAAHAAERGFPCVYFSGEVDTTELVFRLVAARAGVDSTALQTRAGILSLTSATSGKVAEAFAWVSRLALHIDDGAAPSMTAIAAKVRAMPVPPALVIVDHVGLVRPETPRAERHLELEEISRAMKAMAKTSRCAVLAIGHLNREVEKRRSPKRNAKPRLSDARGSDSFAMDADIAWLLHADEDEEGRLAPVTELFVRKNRQGATGRIALRFDGPHQTFEELTT